MSVADQGSPNKRPLARINGTSQFVDGPVEDHLARYTAAGFTVSDHIANWDPGLHCGFVNLWPENIEFITVADELAFGSGSDAQLRADRALGRIHALDVYSDDVHTLRAKLLKRGIAAPNIESERLATTAADAEPDFYFLPLPQLPGAKATAMTSTFPNAAMRRFVNIAPNGVFALAGLTMVVDDPAAAQAAWADVVEPGVHRLTFLTADQWHRHCPEANDDAGVVCLHLRSADAAGTVSAMTNAGWQSGDAIDGEAHLLPRAADGLRFTVEPGDPDAWVQRRYDVLGEELTLRGTRCHRVVHA